MTSPPEYAHVPPGTRGHRLLVGLEPALETLGARYRDARHGEVRAVVLNGGPGMGKTALISEFLDTLRHSSKPPHVLRAQGDLWESQLQLAVYTQLVTTSTAASGTDHDPVVPGATMSSRALAPDQLVRHATTLGAHIDAVQTKAPVIVVVDDVHWADTASLRILVFVLRRLRGLRVLFVLALDRTAASHVPSGVLDHLTGDELTQVTLAALTPVQTRHLARRGFSLELSGGTAHELVHHTGGNPAQITELLHEMPPETWRTWFPGLPPSSRVRSRVESILAGASPDLAAVAKAAALMGETATLTEVARVAQIRDEKHLLTALDEGHSVGLLRLDLQQASSHVRFLEPSAAAAVDDWMLPSERVELHRRASTVVPDEARRLGHLVSAAPSADPELAATLEGLAGRQARQGAWKDVATALFSSARLTDDVRLRNDRLLRAVDAIISSGNVAEARSWMPAVDDMHSSALRSSVMGSLSVVSGESVTAQTQLATAWRSVNPRQEPDTAAHIAQRNVLHGLASWDGPAMIEWAERSMGLTDRSEPAYIESEAIYGLGLFATGRVGEAREAYSRAFDHCQENAQKQRVEMGAGWFSLRTDETETALTRFEFASPTRFRGGSLRISLWSEAWLARTQLILGQWDAALATVARAAERLETVQMTLMRPLLYWPAVEIHAMRGNWDQAAHFLARAAASADDYVCMAVPSLLARVRFYEGRSDYESALDCLEQVAEIDPWTESRVSFWPWQDTYVNALVQTGDVERAEEVLTQFEAVPRPVHIPSDQARLRWARGRVLAAQGEPETAAGCFEAALNELRSLNRPYLRARVSFAFGQSMRRAGKRRLASTALRAARDLYEMLGATTYVQRCDRELKATGVELGLPPDPADTVLAEVQRERIRLTPQETAVAQVVARGATNKQVANQLFIAEKTVQYHLTRIYAKLGIRSRTELAAHYRSTDDLG